MIAVNQDRKGITYVSVMESVKYPIFAVQSHPEFHAFNFVTKLPQ